MKAFWNTAKRVGLFALQVAHSAIETTTNIPAAVKRIYSHQRLASAVKNAVRTNVVEYGLPIAAIQVAQAAPTVIAETLALENSVALFAVGTANFLFAWSGWLLSIALTARVSALNVANLVIITNATAETFSNSNDAEFLLLHNRCQHEFKERLLFELVLLGQFAAGSLYVPALKKLPLVGRFINAWWIGFNFGLYPAAAQELCGKDQVSVLVENRAQWLGFGLLIPTLTTLLAYLLTFIIDLPIPAIALTVIDNCLALFAIVLARETPLDFKSDMEEEFSLVEKCSDSEPSNWENIKYLDPVLASWESANHAVPIFLNYIRDLLRGNKSIVQNRFWHAMNLVWDKLHANIDYLKPIITSMLARLYALNPTFCDHLKIKIHHIGPMINAIIAKLNKISDNPIGKIFIPREFFSLDNLFANPVLRYEAPKLFAQMKSILHIAKGIADMQEIQTCRWALKTRFGKAIEYAANLYLRKHFELGETTNDIVNLASKILRSGLSPEHFSWLIERLGGMEPKPEVARPISLNLVEDHAATTADDTDDDSSYTQEPEWQVTDGHAILHRTPRAPSL